MAEGLRDEMLAAVQERDRWSEVAVSLARRFKAQKLHRQLGYATWDEFCVHEIKRSRSYVHRMMAADVQAKMLPAGNKTTEYQMRRQREPAERAPRPFSKAAQLGSRGAKKSGGGDASHSVRQAATVIVEWLESADPTDGGPDELLIASALGQMHQLLRSLPR